MTVLRAPYHFGLVVEDLERAKDDLTSVLGLSWATTQRRSNLVERQGGRTPVEVCFTYSLEGPPYFELIERRPGSIFDELGLHHIGLWTNDRTSDSAHFSSHGWPREAVNITPEGQMAGGLYHTGTCGLRVELVDIGRSGPALLNYLDGGDYRVAD